MVEKKTDTATSSSAESALIAAALAGETSAFELLVIKHQTGLVRFLEQFVRNTVDYSAEDIAQEAFVRAYRALATFRGESSFFTWLRRIGLNLVRDKIRSRRNEPIMVDDSALEFMSSSDSPDMVLQQKQLAEAIQVALDNLPEKWRQPLLLREIDGMDYQEISNVLEIPIGTVRSRIFRARHAIAGHIGSLADKISV